MKEARQIIRWSRHHVIIPTKPTTWGIYRTLELLKSFLNIISLKLYKSPVYEVWLRGRNQGSVRWHHFFKVPPPIPRCQRWDTAPVCGLLQAIPFTMSLFSYDMCHNRRGAECDWRTLAEGQWGFHMKNKHWWNVGPRKMAGALGRWETL